jgi:hypothetical protein
MNPVVSSGNDTVWEGRRLIGRIPRLSRFLDVIKEADAAQDDDKEKEDKPAGAPHAV